ncbi:MAG: 3-deoxy-manno-octulosonate cytidylyltransferase [Candidatus Eisenbacteria bacterium]|nr:3-deoxy-manno-octulosonate cytidylyltransferase [Candidatus Eisenbacteria bacterium]
MRVLGVIPARFGSTRFPGKALVSLHGRPMIEQVMRRARRVHGLDELLVATDDERIAEAVRHCGGAVELTGSGHATGSDRIGEVVNRRSPRPEFVVNLQGDEPLLPVAAVSGLIAAMVADPTAIWTLAAPLRAPEEFIRPSVVKIARAADGRALYFSRAPIPHGGLEMDNPPALRHLGIYGYPIALFDRFLALGPSRLESCERLEQLRALEAGLTIKVALSTAGSPGVDTPEDLDRLLRRYPTLEALDGAEE